MQYHSLLHPCSATPAVPHLQCQRLHSLQQEGRLLCIHRRHLGPRPLPLTLLLLLQVCVHQLACRSEYLVSRLQL